MKLATILIFSFLINSVVEQEYNKCTINQIRNENICPGLATICEFEIYYFNEPQSFPSKLKSESYRNHKINKLMRKSLEHKLFQEWREYQQSLDNQIIPTQRFINIIFESRAVEEIKKYLKILQLKLFLLLSI